MQQQIKNLIFIEMNRYIINSTQGTRLVVQ